MEDEIPKEMYRQGRPPDPNFPPEECLFIRFQKMDGGKVHISDLRYPDQSANREKYSQPEWILFPLSKFGDWGYGFIRVREVPPEIPEIRLATAAWNRCQVEHDPEEENYSHSEIRGYKNAIRVTNNNRKKTIEAKFRDELRRKIVIQLYPEEYREAEELET
jgi:hypothetical protein